MQVFVKLYATLKEYAPKGIEIGESFSVEFEGRTLMDLITSMGLKIEQTKIVMINGNRVTGLNHQLSVGDMVVIFPPVGGG